MNARRAFLRTSCLISAGFLAACQNRQPAGSTPAGPQITGPAPSAALPTPVMVEAIVLAGGLNFPEGPAFDPQGGLWCTELLGGNLVQMVDGQVRRYPVGGGPGGRGNGLAFDSQGRAWVADSGRNAIQRFDPAAGTWELVLDAAGGKPLQSPNDLVFDPAGNLLFTCPNFASTQETGYVVCLTPEGEAQIIAEGFNRPNGLAVVDGGASLVVADTYRKTLYKGAWDAQAAEWTDPRPWAQVGGSEGPDGMALGGDNLIYQAVYGDGVIRMIDAGGQVVRAIGVPGANPTNVAVDPSGTLGIVVTETDNGQLLSLPSVQPGAPR